MSNEFAIHVDEKAKHLTISRTERIRLRDILRESGFDVGMLPWMITHIPQ